MIFNYSKSGYEILNETSNNQKNLFGNITIKDGDKKQKSVAINILTKNYNKIINKFADDGWNYIVTCREEDLKHSNDKSKMFHPEFKNKNDFKKAIKVISIKLFLKPSGTNNFMSAEIYAEPEGGLDEHVPTLEVYFKEDGSFKIPYNVQYDG